MALEHTNTIAKDNLKNKVQKEQKKKNNKIKFYHSFMTIVLLLCVFQIGYSALLNISKIVIYRAKIIKSNDLKLKAQKRNEKLKEELNNFNSMQRVESIARNNLKMAAENEVLVIINEPEPEIYTPKTFKQKLIFFFEENVAKKFVHQDSLKTGRF